MTAAPTIRVQRPGDVYADDAFVFWGFGSEALRRLAERAGFAAFEPHDAPIIDGHPRIIASLTLAPDDPRNPPCASDTRIIRPPTS